MWQGLALLLIASVLLQTCSSQSTKRQENEAVPSGVSPEQQKKLDEAKAEMEVGRNMAGRLLKFYGAYPDEKLVRYVNEVGNYVASRSDFPERRYMFEVYYSDEINAFACPGGYILISLGSIKNASNEAELAHVLGHEVAHVGKKHMMDTLSKMDAQKLEEAAANGAKFKQLPPEVLIRKRPEPEETGFGTDIARYLTGGSVGLNILQAAKAGMSLIMEKGLGAELEYEADKEGTRYAINAGYSPKALINFLCRLEKRRGRPDDYCLEKQAAKLAEVKSVLDRTHPAVPDRVAGIKQVLIAMKAGDIVGAKGSKRYQVIKDRIIGNNNDSDKDSNVEPALDSGKE